MLKGMSILILEGEVLETDDLSEKDDETFELQSENSGVPEFTENDYEEDRSGFDNEYDDEIFESEDVNENSYDDDFEEPFNDDFDEDLDFNGSGDEYNNEYEETGWGSEEYK